MYAIKSFGIKDIFVGQLKSGRRKHGMGWQIILIDRNIHQFYGKCVFSLIQSLIKSDDEVHHAITANDQDAWNKNIKLVRSFPTRKKNLRKSTSRKTQKTQPYNSWKNTWFHRYVWKTGHFIFSPWITWYRQKQQLIKTSSALKNGTLLCLIIYTNNKFINA